MDWTVISSRESSSMVDTWQDYLYIRAAPDGEGWELGLCGYEVLGEPPSEWFDDDGNPLPEYQDEFGDLKLPDEWEGCPVSHYDGEYIVGDLTLNTDDSIAQIEAATSEVINDALLSLGWIDDGVGKKIEAFCAPNEGDNQDTADLV